MIFLYFWLILILQSVFTHGLISLKARWLRKLFTFSLYPIFSEQQLSVCEKRKYACAMTALRQGHSHVIKLKETGGLNEDRGSPPQDTVRVGRGQCLNTFSLPLFSQRCGCSYGHTANKIRLQGGPQLASCTCICVCVCVREYLCKHVRMCSWMCRRVTACKAETYM